MPLTLNTNIDSLNAQRNLTTSKSSLSQALQRLSSGLRINSAADDAAGLAISQRFTTQINGTNQAVNNANDAVSEAQTAGGALSTLTANLQSIRTLAVQSANGSNSAADRAALDAEVQQQISEITRIASQTSFNGTKVLDGSSGVTVFQVGANVGNTISVNLTQGTRADQIGQTATLTSGTVSATALTSANPLSIQVGTGASTVIGATAVGSAGAAAGQTANSAYAKVQAINTAGVAGLTASANTTVTGVFTAITSVTSSAATYDLTINGSQIYSGAGNLAVGATLSANQVATQINLYSAATGVTASVSGGNLSLNAADGRNIDITQTVAAGAAGATIVGTGLPVGIAGAATGVLTTTQGNITLSAANNITIGGSGSADIGYTANGQTISLNAQTLANQNVLTVSGANATIAAIDSALATVSAFQSQLGAIQNRFTSTVQNLQSTVQNLTSSRSTIQDADFAAETAKLTQSNVLQQAGISILAQANQQPQLILKLLQ
jgi:flagellin